MIPTVDMHLSLLGLTWGPVASWLAATFGSIAATCGVIMVRRNKRERAERQARENSRPEWEPEDPSGIDPYIRFGRVSEHVRVMNDFQEMVDRQCTVTITNTASLQIRMRPYQSNTASSAGR